MDGYRLGPVEEEGGRLRIVAYREDGGGVAPGRVDVVVDAAMHEVARVEMTWPDAPAPTAPVPSGGFELLDRAPRPTEAAPPRRVLLEWTGAPALPADWFEPETHAR